MQIQEWVIKANDLRSIEGGDVLLHSFGLQEKVRRDPPQRSEGRVSLSVCTLAVLILLIARHSVVDAQRKGEETAKKTQEPHLVLIFVIYRGCAMETPPVPSWEEELHRLEEPFQEAG
jgi:hypothetical protein